MILPHIDLSPACCTDKQVEEWLATYYEQVYKRYRGEGREFQQRTRFIPQSILRLYRALRQAYSKPRGQPDRAETLFEDLEKGYFRNRKTRAEYGVHQQGDMFVQEDVEYNRNEAGQREEDYQSLLDVFGSAQRLEEARRAVTLAVNQMRFSHSAGRAYRDSVGAVGVVRQLYFGQAKKFIEQGIAPDSASDNPQVRTATRVLRLSQPIKLAPSVVNGVTTTRAMKTPLDIIIEREYPWLAAREVAENDPYREQMSADANDPDSGLDQDQVTSINEMANAIGTRAYYLEDKNREARSGKELELIMETVPLFERDLTTGKYYRSPEGYAVDPSDVKRIIKNMGRRAREIAAFRGRTQPTLEDLREALSERILSSDGRTMTSTGRQHANLASVYRRLFDAPVGSVGGLTQLLLPGMTDTDNRETSLYATAFPTQIGAPTTRINPDANPDDIRWGTDAQRLLSQLLSYATGIERRDFLSVDMTTGQKEDKGRNAELMRKNFNQSSLLTSLFKKTNNRWVPRRERLEGLRTESASFRFELLAPDRNEHAGLPRMQVIYSGNVTGQDKVQDVPVFIFSAAPNAMPYEAAMLRGQEVADLDQDVMLEAAHALIRNLGLPLSKAQLREMVLSEVDPKRADHNSFRSKLPQFLANMYVPLLAAHYHNDVNRDLLSGMGVEDGSLITQEPVLREGVGSFVDDLDQVGAGDERGGDKKAENPRQFSPTGRWSDVQWLARQQERNVESGTPDFTYNYEGNKMHRDQLGNGVYHQLRSLGLQARRRDDKARFNALIQDVIEKAKGRDENFSPENYPEYMAGMTENVIRTIGYDPRGNYVNEGLFNPAAGYTNRVASQAWQVEVLQANDLTDKRTGKKKAFVAGTPAELHEAGIVHVFLRSVVQGASQSVRLLGTTISDKSTQRIFALNSQGGNDRVIVDLGSAQERERILHVKNSYSALLRGSILPRYQAAGLAIASDPATLSDEQLLDLLQGFLNTNPDSIKALAENADYVRKAGALSVNPLLRQMVSMSDEEFVQMVKTDNDAEAQNIYAEGLVVLPYKLVKSLASYLDQDWKDVEQNFATAGSGQDGDEGDTQTERDENKNKVPRYLRVRRELKDEKGNVTGYEYNPALRLFTSNNFLLQHELFTALNGHHLYYKNKGDAGLVDMVKRGIINATNYEAFDVSTPRGLGQTSRLLLIDDETFNSILGSENVDRYPYLNEDGTPGVFERVSEDNQTLALINEMGFNDGKLRSQDLFDGQGYMLPLHAILEDESLGGKYLRDATPDEMQRLGLTGPAIKLFSSATRKNFLGQASSSSDGAPAMLKVADAVLTNGFLDQANGRVWRLRQLMLGGPNSPLYLRWQQIYDESTPQQRAMNYDWIRLHEEFIRPENRAVWEPYLIGRAGHPSGFKVAPRRVNGWNSAQELQSLDEVGVQQWIAGNTLLVDNQSYGKVLDLSADPFLQSISRITQEDHIVSLLRDNYKTSKELYRLLSLLAEEGLFKLQDEVDEAGGKAYFMGRLADLLQNMGNVSNTLSLARDAGTSANHPLVAKALQNAIATSLKAYSVKQRMDGVRATVQSSTGLVNMYQIKGGTRLTQGQALRSGFIERDANGDLRPTMIGQALSIQVDELAFMRLYDKQTNQLVPEQQAREFVRAVARAEVDSEAAKLVDEYVQRYRIEPMEVLVSRDTVAKFNIDPWRDVNDVTEKYFIEREEQAVREKFATMSDEALLALPFNEAKLKKHQAWMEATGQLKRVETSRQYVEVRRAFQLNNKLRAARGRGQEVWENWQKALQPKNTRIPVTNMNSVQLARVVGFVDGAMNTQLVPSELLTVAGADNDGDMSTMEFFDVRPGGYSYRGILPQASDDTEVKLDDYSQPAEEPLGYLDQMDELMEGMLPREQLVRAQALVRDIEKIKTELEESRAGLRELRHLAGQMWEEYAGRHHQLLDNHASGRLRVPVTLVQQARHQLRHQQLADPRNIDQLLRPVDFSSLALLVSRAKEQMHQIPNECVQSAVYGTLRGVLRHHTNVELLVRNRLGSGGLRQLMKFREVYDAAVRIERSLGICALTEPVFFMGHQVNRLAQNEHAVGDLFAVLANAVLQNEEENYLGWLNYSPATWSLWATAVITFQNLEHIGLLLTHPVTRQLVHWLEQRNDIRLFGHEQGLLSWLGQLLTNADADVLNRSKSSFLAGLSDLDSRDWSATIGLFGTVQAAQRRRYEIFRELIRGGMGEAQARLQAYPDLQCDVADPALSAEDKNAIQQYVLENLYLLAVRAAETTAMLQLLAVGQGPARDDSVSLRQLATVANVLRIGKPENPDPVSIRRQFGSVPDLDAQVQELAGLLGIDSVTGKATGALSTKERQQRLHSWASELVPTIVTFNPRYLLVENEFLQQCLRVLIVDYYLRRGLFITRHPRVMALLEAVENQTLAARRQVHIRPLLLREFDRFLDGITMQPALQRLAADLDLLSQQIPGSRALAKMAACRFDGVAGRQHFVQLAAEYMLQIRVGAGVDWKGNNGIRPVCENPLVQSLDFTGAPDRFLIMELRNATGLTAGQEEQLRIHFLDLGVRYGAPGKAVQLVLLIYQLLTKGMNTGRGTLVRVLDMTLLSSYNQQRHMLQKKLQTPGGGNLHAQLEAFRHQFFLLNPWAAPLIHFPGERNPATVVGVEVDGIEQNFPSVFPATGFAGAMNAGRRASRFWTVAPDELPDELSQEYIQATFPQQNELAGVSRYLRLANVWSPGRVVLYSALPGESRWYRTYQVASAVVNQYGELPLRNTLPAYMTLDVDDPLDWRNSGSDFALYLQQVAVRAIRSGQITADGVFEIRIWGNRPLRITRSMYMGLSRG